MFRTGATIALFLIANGCATVEMDAVENVNFEHVQERSYVLGLQQAVPVGGVVLRVRDYAIEHRGIRSVRATMDFSVRGCMHDIPFSEGQVLSVSGRRSVDGQDVMVVPTIGYQFGIPNTALSVQVLSDGRIHNKIISNGVEMVHDCVPDNVDARLIPVNVDRISTDRPYLNYEIVFSGSDENAMHFIYREYSVDDLVGPGFFQDLSYPVEAETIRFRNIVIDVVGLDDQSITYVVQSDD